MVLLRVFSKDDVKYIPYEYSPDVRINLTELLNLDFSQTLLVYKGVSFALQAGRAEKIFKKGDDFFSERVCGRFEDMELNFKDRNSRIIEKIKYILIKLDTEMLPWSIADAVFFHELREVYWQIIFGMPQPSAHRKARAEEKDYALKFLSPDEKKLLAEFKDKRIISKVNVGKS